MSTSLAELVQSIGPNMLALFVSLSAAGGSKLGLCCEECTAAQYAPFAKSAKWVYRYSLFVDDTSTAAWLSSNNVEFVPHLAHKLVPLSNSSAHSACTFNADDAKKYLPLCTDTMLDSALTTKTNQRLSMRYMMGWNEAYDDSGSKKEKKYIAPADAATYWRTFVQGLALRHNLTLVSPTTGVTKGKLEWMGDMLKACWKDRSRGCDVETIQAFSVHDYKCSETYWSENYGRNGTFQTNLKAYLGGADKDWKAYVDARPIWVTETNCNGDYGFPPTQSVSRSEQCMRITGQRADQDCGLYGKCGVGSIAWMETSPTIGRVSWWNTHQQNKKNATKTFDAMLVGTTGELFPAGKALANGLITMDCS